MNPRLWRFTLDGLARLGQAVFTVWLAATLSFFALKLIPGDPVEARLGPLAGVSEEQKERIRISLGLDQPIGEQYLSSLGQMLRGDFGHSYQQNLEVTEVLGRQLGPTMQLAGLAILFMMLLITMGQVIRRTGTDWRQNGVRTAIVDTFQLISVSVPTYWIGYALLIIFSFSLGWFPSSSNRGIASLILPAMSLAIPLAGLMSRVLDIELDAVERSAFALSSRSRGMGRGQFAFQHGLRHTLMPLAGLLSTLVGGILGGAVLIENVFARPGLGRVALHAITSRDMPVIIGIVVLSATVFALLGLLADLIVWWADPRPGTRAA